MDIIQNNKNYFFAKEILGILESLKEGDVQDYQDNILKKRRTKSCGAALNGVLKSELESSGWKKLPVFYSKDGYSLFCKNNISMNMFWGHTGSGVEKIMSHLLAHEPHHSKKLIESDLGIIVSITKGTKKIGGFDSGAIVFDNFVHHLECLKNKVKMPILLIGLDFSKSFLLKENMRGNR